MHLLYTYQMAPFNKKYFRPSNFYIRHSPSNKQQLYETDTATYMRESDINSKSCCVIQKTLPKLSFSTNRNEWKEPTSKSLQATDCEPEYLKTRFKVSTSICTHPIYSNMLMIQKFEGDKLEEVECIKLVVYQEHNCFRRQSRV